MNKYQKALDWLKTIEVWNGMCYEELQVDIRFDEKFKILQELINIATTPICEDCEPTDLEEAKIKLRLMADECNRQTKLLEKALDKVCGELFSKEEATFISNKNGMHLKNVDDIKGEYLEEARKELENE